MWKLLSLARFFSVSHNSYTQSHLRAYFFDNKYERLNCRGEMCWWWRAYWMHKIIKCTNIHYHLTKCMMFLSHIIKKSCFQLLYDYLNHIFLHTLPFLNWMVSVTRCPSCATRQEFGFARSRIICIYLVLFVVFTYSIYVYIHQCINIVKQLIRNFNFHLLTTISRELFFAV